MDVKVLLKFCQHAKKKCGENEVELDVEGT